MLEKYLSFSNTLAYLLPSSNMQRLSIVSVDHFPPSVFLWNILSARYLLERGRVALQSRFCVVFFKVCAAWPILINHRSIRSCGLLSECLAELWNVCIFCTSDVPTGVGSRTRSSLLSVLVIVVPRSLSIADMLLFLLEDWVGPFYLWVHIVAIFLVRRERSNIFLRIFCPVLIRRVCNCIAVMRLFLSSSHSYNSFHFLIQRMIIYWKVNFFWIPWLCRAE